MPATSSSRSSRVPPLILLAAVTALGPVVWATTPASAFAAATQIVLTDSGPLLIGQPTTLTATIEDSSGNTVTSGPDSTASVTFAQTSGTGTVEGLGSVPAVDGVATDVVTGTAIGDGMVNLQAGASLDGGATATSSPVLAATFDAFHGISVLKNCNGTTLIGQPLECRYRIVNNVDTANDTLTVDSITDQVFAFDGTVTSANLLPALALSFSGGASCDGGQSVCTLPAGSSITSGLSSFYTVAPDDFDLMDQELADQATVTWSDLCNGGSGNCSTSPQTAEGPSSTLVLQYTPSVSTRLAPTGSVLVGTPVDDQATLTGASPDAGGTVSYAVYSDSGCTAPVATLGTQAVTDGEVGASESWTAVAGTYWFQATYSGDPSNAGPVVSPCSSEPLTVQAPGIGITKLPLTQQIQSGGTASWTIAVMNTGNVVLSNVTVTDPVAPGCDTTFPGTLAPGASEASYGCSLSGAVSGFVNTATVTGTPPMGPNVSATASAAVTVAPPPHTALTETASAKIVGNGVAVNFTYLEKNTGAVGITGVAVTGSVCGAATFVSSSDGDTATLDPGATWTFQCTVTVNNPTAKVIKITDVATATGVSAVTGQPAPVETAEASVKVKPGPIPCGIAVSASPSPLVETGGSNVATVVQVEACPQFAGDKVAIGSPQLVASCAGPVVFHTLQPGAHTTTSIQVVLDDDGNATVSLTGADCASGLSVIDADLTSSPYSTALTTLDVLAPDVTPLGVAGYPANEVETGDTTASGTSDVYAVFYVEVNAVYAENKVEISSTQLQTRCLGGVQWTSNLGTFPGATATATLDDDGNAAFVFSGSSCAAGSSVVEAEVLAGTHTTYTGTYTIEAPVQTPSV